MTRKFDLTTDWTEIATGPCYIEAIEGTVLVHLAEAAPDPEEDAYHNLGAGFAPHLSHWGTKNAYARTTQLGGIVIVSEAT